MLRVFRIIRKSLIESSKTRKYLLYAIGEILLVMIGILLALQVNNWNEEVQARKQEFVILEAIKKDLLANIIEIDSIILEKQRRVKGLVAIIDAIEQDLPFHDSLTTHFGWAMIYSRISLQRSAYQSYIASGSQVVADESLRFEISHFFDHKLVKLENYIIETRDDFYSYMLGYLRELFENFVAVDQIGIPRDFEAMKDNKDFEVSLKIFLDVTSDAWRGLKKSKNDSEEFLKKLEDRISILTDYQ